MDFDDSIQISGHGLHGSDAFVESNLVTDEDDSNVETGVDRAGKDDFDVETSGDELDIANIKVDFDLEVPNSTTIFVTSNSTTLIDNTITTVDDITTNEQGSDEPLVYNTKDVADQHEIPNSTSVSNTNISIVINHVGRNDTSKKFKISLLTDNMRIVNL